MATLFLVRHGETEANSRERYWGSRDVRLSALGLAQAERLGRRLAGVRLDAVYASDLSRAQVTAQAIAVPRGLAVTACPELREVDFGLLEGLKFTEIGERFPEVARQWAERRADLQYPGGESLVAFGERVATFANRLASLGPDARALIVAHSGVLRTLLCQLMLIDPRHRWQFFIDFASLTILTTSPQGARLELLNDTSHLDGLAGEGWVG